MDYRIVPMRGKWPGALEPGAVYSRASFSVTYAKTLKYLDHEVKHLEGSHVVFQLEVGEDEIRMDGGLRANSKPAHPGIVVTFNSKYGPLSYYSDEYSDWRSNLRAITLALQYLRLVDEHGVNKRGDQYEGYKRLPPASATANARRRISTEEEAAAFISKHYPAVTALLILRHSPIFETAYKQASRKLHPDAGPGNEDAWVDLQDAAVILKKRRSGSQS